MTEKYLGIDVGGTEVKLGIVTGAGEVLLDGSFPLRSENVETTVMERILNGVKQFLREQNVEADSLSGIGVSAAGLIDSKHGRVSGTGANLPGWSGTEVCAELTAEFHLPASLANDARCAILAESWLGAAKGCDDVLGVILGTGIGGGVISGGHLLTGANGYAGEIGHFPFQALGGEACGCGLSGCFERYASTSALVRAASAKNPNWNDGRAVFSAAAQGDEDALEVLDEWTDRLALGLAGLVHIFNPTLIVIGGGVSAQTELLIDPLRKKVLGAVMPDYAESLDLRPALLGNRAGFLGAVRFFLQSH